MAVQDVISAVQSVGFPIVVCFACFWYVRYITDKHREDTNQLMANHNQEIGAVTTALNNNTLALQQLVDKIEHLAERS